MIDPELIEVKQHGKLFLKDIEFECTCCGCYFKAALKHIIEDASKNMECEENLRCRIENEIDMCQPLDNGKIRRVLYTIVPCPECTNRVGHEMIISDKEKYSVQKETITDENT